MKKYINFALCTLIFALLFSSVAWAMGGKPPAKVEPKYKLEILKMEIVPAVPSSPEGLSSKKVLMILAPKDFQDQEFSKPKDLLEAKGVKVTIASTTLKEAIGMYGSKVKPDILIKDAKAADYDAVVFIGGNGALALVDNPQALSLAIEAKKYNKVIGAICVAPMILAKAGVLEGKKSAVSSYGKSVLKKRGAVCTGKSVEIDGKIVTGSGPGAAEEFGEALIKTLSD